MVAAGRLYTVHGLWWVRRRRGREGCRGVGEGGLFVFQHQHQNSRGREERGEGRDAGSSCTAQETEAGLPSLCMQINRIPEHRWKAVACTVQIQPSERGCVSSAMMSWFILRKWCQASAVRLAKCTAIRHLLYNSAAQQVLIWILYLHGTYLHVAAALV